MKGIAIPFQNAIFALIISMMITIANGFSIKLISRDSIESPLFPKNLTLEERHERIVELSRAHALNLRFVTSNASKSNEVTDYLESNVLQPSVARARGNFYVLLAIIGGQLHPTYLVVDSGSDNTWVQCHGCKRCFRVKGGNFNPKLSRTFRPLPCNHPLCVPKMCQGPTCIYDTRYLSGYSKGMVGVDTFAFPIGTNNRTSESFRNLAFGCGNENVISFGENDGFRNVITGIFGLGYGRRSFLTQLGQLTNGRFSYCLPSWSSRQGTSTILRFGNDAQIRGDNQRRVQTTPLVRGMPRYYFNVYRISLQGTILSINPALFKLRPPGVGGFIIDSGAGHTLLVRAAYNTVKDVMVQYFQRYNMNPARGVHRSYDLCYKRPSRNITLPSMTLHFEGGADLVLNDKAIFETFKNGFCMIIMPTDGVNILGAFQQANHRFLFDTRASTLSFVPENCQEN